MKNEIMNFPQYIGVDRRIKLEKLCLDAGIKTKNPTGAYNKRYGYKRLPKVFIIENQNKLEEYERLVKMMEKRVVAKEQPSEDDIAKKWANRLVRLTNVSVEDALEIAEEKLSAKFDEIAELYKRQSERFSIKRAKLIERIKRSNPLRRIKDAEHASNILGASARHNSTDYNKKLEEGRHLAFIGEIEMEEVRDWARENKQGE